MKDYCIQKAKPQLDVNWLKSPPLSFLPFGEILSSHCVTWHNFAKPYFMHHWTSHWGPGRKAPSPATKEGKNSDTKSIHFMQFPATLVQLAESPPPLWTKRGKFWDRIYPFHAISSNFGSTGKKKAPPPSFLPFHERPDWHCTCRITMVPILQIHTQIPPIRISSLGYQLCKLFKILYMWVFWKVEKVDNLKKILG